MGYPIGTVLRIVKLSRSTYYYRKNKTASSKVWSNAGGRPIPGYSWTFDGHRVSDEIIKQWLVALIGGEGLFYGYLKLTHALRRQFNLNINKKKVYRLCKELDILRPQRKIKPRHPRRVSSNRKVTGPNQLWETDIKYGYIAGEKRFFYVLSIIDVYDRSIVADYIGLNCTAKNAADTLRAAFERRQHDFDGRLPVIRSDNGPQFTSHFYEHACRELNVYHELIPCKTPNKNAHIESYHSILEEECLGHYEFYSYLEAYEAVTQFRKFYNQQRIHSGVNYMSPSEFYEAYYRRAVKLMPIAV